MFYSGKKPFLVGLDDQDFQAAQNLVESFFLFDLCLSFCAASSAFTSVQSFNRHRFLVQCRASFSSRILGIKI